MGEYHAEGDLYSLSHLFTCTWMQSIGRRAPTHPSLCSSAQLDPFLSLGSGDGPAVGMEGSLSGPGHWLESVICRRPMLRYAARMRLLRKRVRSFFAFQSVLMVVSGGLKLSGALSMDNVSSASAHFMVALMFAGAWWTTRKTSPNRNPWAMAVSFVSVVTGGYIAWAARVHGGVSRSGWLSVILGVAGLYLYSQGGRAPRAMAAAGRQTESVSP